MQWGRTDFTILISKQILFTIKAGISSKDLLSLRGSCKRAVKCFLQQ